MLYNIVLLLLLLLSHFSRVRLCATTQTAAHQAPPSLGFSRQEQEWVAISSSNAWKWKVKVKSLSRVRLLATPWTAAYQAPPSMGFSRQEYWSGLPLPSPNIVLVSAKHQHESAVSIHVSPPSWTSLPSPAPFHPCRMLESGLSSLSQITNCHWLSTLHMVIAIPF